MKIKDYLNYCPNTGNFTWLCDRGTNKVKNKIAGSIHSDGYLTIQINGKSYKAHRLAWHYHYNKWPSGQIDHINGIKNDNRIENLRDVTSSENSKNRLYHRDRTLKPLLNIHYRKSKDFYEVIINNKYIGGSIDLNTAIQIRDNYLTKKSSGSTI